MPLFELDESGSRLVRPMQPAPGSFGPESAELVTQRLSELLGEGLFPVARRRRPEDPSPHLLALDVVGQPVVVEVVQELDPQTLIRALGFAGQAGRMTSGDLARLYEAGEEQFRVDLMAFRESLPAAYSRRGLRVGARLLIVCATVHPEVRDSLDFLRAPGRQVEVMQMGVIHGASGRRYLDVSPLAGPVAEMRQVEQASLRLVRSDEAFAAAMAYDEERRRTQRFAAVPGHDPAEVRSPFGAGEGVAQRFPEVPTPPVSPPTAPSPQVPEASPSVPAPAALTPHPQTPPAPPQPVPPVSQVPPLAPEEPPAAPQRTSVLGNGAAGGGVPDVGAPGAPGVSGASGAPGATAAANGQIVDGRYVPAFVPAESPLVPPDARPLEDTGSVPPVGQPGVPRSQQTAAVPPAPPTGHQAPVSSGHQAPVPSGHQAPVVQPPTFAQPAPFAPSPPRPATPPAASLNGHAVPPTPTPAAPTRLSALRPDLPPPMALPSSPTPVVRHSALSAMSAQVPAEPQDPHPRLLRLVAETGPVDLVWYRERRRQRLVARLRQDGLLELPTGEVFADPSAAAQHASRAALRVDGWGVWRVGNEDGPTLAERV